MERKEPPKNPPPYEPNHSTKTVLRILMSRYGNPMDDFDFCFSLSFFFPTNGFFGVVCLWCSFRGEEGIDSSRGSVL